LSGKRANHELARQNRDNLAESAYPFRHGFVGTAYLFNIDIAFRD
jgi:hypothetical protein